MKSVQERFESKLLRLPEAGCWLWLACLNREGYGRITIYAPTKKSIEAHRVSWELYKGDIPTGLCVLHRCDVRSCVNPHHLFLGTVLDNNIDRDLKRRGRWASGEKHGRYTKPQYTPRGERHWKARLTEVDIVKIREDQRKQRLIARDFGISQTMVSQIKLGKAWKHLTREHVAKLKQTLLDLYVQEMKGVGL